MIRVSGVGAVAETDQSLFGDSLVIVADTALLEKVGRGELREQVTTAIGGSRAVVWIAAGPPPRLTACPVDATGRAVRTVQVAASVAIEEGTLLLGGVDAGARLVTEGGDAGVLAFDGVVDPWIRYFFPSREPPGDVEGYRFRVAELAGDLPAAIRFDAARPFTSSASSATPRDDAPLRSSFRDRWGSVVTLAPVPSSGRYVWVYDPGLDEAYTTLAGRWHWAVEPGAVPPDPGDVELLLGFSGVEYVTAPRSFVVRFVPAGPAFAPDHRAARRQSGTAPPRFPLVSAVPGVAQPVTTAWLYPEPPVDALPSAVARYYSQPERAPLFVPRAVVSSAAPMEPLSLASATLPRDAVSPHVDPASFPVAPYAGVADTDGQVIDIRASELERFESDVLSAARTEVIYGLQSGPVGFVGGAGLARSGAGGADAAGPAWMDSIGATGASPTGPTGPTEAAVTPQGMVSLFSREDKSWRQWIIAQSQHGNQRLLYTEVTGKLRQALLASQLFLVVSDPCKLYEACSTLYCITDQVIASAKEATGGLDPPLGVWQLRGTVFYGLEYYDAALLRVMSSAEYELWQPQFVRYGERAELAIGEWTFDLASRRWADPASPTILIVKFADGDVEEMIGDLGSWTLPDAFNDNPLAVQKQLLDIVESARARVASEPELAYFVDTVLANRQESTGRDVWNGVLYLNPAVPSDAFPPDLAALAAGLPGGPLRAHHLGVTVSPFDVIGGSVVGGDSSLFGVILYDDPTDLVYQGDPYDFKVLSLRVRFMNSVVVEFSSQVELLVGQLFNELATLEEGFRGSNIVFDGTVQGNAYRFVSASSNRFAITSHVLDHVTVDRAAFVTVSDESTAPRLSARFILDGSMGFKRLGDFDLFGYGAASDPAKPADDGRLAFSNLLVSMEFDPSDPVATRTFRFAAGQMTLDPGSSRARSDSLARRYPLQLLRMRQSEPPVDADGHGKVTVGMPADLGFIPVETPLVDGSLGPVWFGLELSLSFGSPGTLAPRLGFTGALLASWAPSADQYNVAVGIQLPGSAGGKRSLTIMGPLTLNIGRLNFLYDTETHGYLLRLQNVALSFLGLTFPPGGRTNALLFGDPDPNGSNTALGWYLAYKKDVAKRETNIAAALGVARPPGMASGMPNQRQQPSTPKG